MSDKDKDKIISLAEQVNRRDIEIILEVNKKAVEIETDVAEQNEEIIKLLTEIKNDEEIITLLTEIKNDQEKIIEQNEEISDKAEEQSRDLFKIQVLFVTGLLALVAQIVQIFLKK